MYTALQLTILVLWVFEGSRTRATIPAAVVALTASLSICVLSYIEHVRSVRPSVILALYSFFSLIFDAFQARTLFLRHASSPLVWTFTAGVGMKCILLILESLPKTAYLKEPYSNLSSEELGGVFNTCFLWWINQLIITGYKKLLSTDDLPKIDTKLKSEPLRDRLQKSWDQRCMLLI